MSTSTLRTVPAYIDQGRHWEVCRFGHSPPPTNRSASPVGIPPTCGGAEGKNLIRVRGFKNNRKEKELDMKPMFDLAI